MRKVVAHMQTTLNNRIAREDGTFWEPFAWGDEEQAYLNELFRLADTWVMSRPIYEAVVPWWETVAAGQLPADVTAVSDVDRDFAQILHGLTKVAISSTLEPTDDRVVIGGDTVTALYRLKERAGQDIVLSAGPTTLGPLADVPGLIDEYLVILHPAVVASGPRLFDGVGRDLALELRGAKVFDRGSVVLRYGVLEV